MTNASLERAPLGIENSPRILILQPVEMGDRPKSRLAFKPLLNFRPDFRKRVGPRPLTAFRLNHPTKTLAQCMSGQFDFVEMRRLVALINRLQFTGDRSRLTK